MLSSSLLVLTIGLPVLAGSVDLFPSDSLVTVLDSKGFRDALKENLTSMVAFVGPSCDHCKEIAPAYSTAALGLYPFVPAYAVDCGDSKNKRLCTDQEVKGFPTVKLFPRGKTLPALTYDQPGSSASAFYYWASRRVPNVVQKVYQKEDIEPWVKETAKSGLPRALLLRKEKKPPMLWTVLANKYKDQIQFAVNRDRKGRSSVFMGLEAGDKRVSKVVVYPAGSTQPVVYEGILKLDSLTRFFDSVLNGTADIQAVNEEAANEEFAPDEKELEIERKQEAQRIALAHGGFSDLIDFEEAIKNGAGANYHDVHGFPGMMGAAPPPKKKTVDANGATEAPVKVGTKVTPSVVEEPTSQAQAVFATPAETPIPSSATGECSASGIAEYPECKPPITERPNDEL